MNCNYVSYSFGLARVFKRKPQKSSECNLEVLEGGAFLLVDAIEADDVLFVKELIKQALNYDYDYFSISGLTINQSILDDVSKFFFDAKVEKANDHTHMCVSVSIASKCLVCDDIYIGCLTLEQQLQNGALSFVPFNAGTLQYKLFKMILNEARNLFNFIEGACLNDDMQKIVAIDNWIQSNIQYIKNTETPANGDVFISDSITREAVMPDVFLNKYGTCEDIAASVCVVLTLLGVDSYVVAANKHAWLLVKYNCKWYIWDPTHNITRNRCRMENALKALRYSYEYTLIGDETFPGKYYYCGDIVVQQKEIPRNSFNKTINALAEKGISFEYSGNSVVPTELKPQY